MNKDKVLEMIKSEMGEVPKPLEALAELDMNVLMGHLEAKKNAYSGDQLDKKTKALIALAVGIALDSQGCIMNNVKAAKKMVRQQQKLWKRILLQNFQNLHHQSLAFQPLWNGY